jgi:hypothetical protein
MAMRIRSIKIPACPGGATNALANTFNLFGDTSAGKGSAVGASIFINVMGDYTDATIDSGAKIGIGSAGALDVDADHVVIAVALVQAGGAAGDIGFAGTAGWYNLTTNTRAQIQDGVTVNAGYDTMNNPLQAGLVTVHADDNMIAVAVSGGAVKSNSVGAGVSFAVNNINRTTLALIGSQTTPTIPGSFTVGALHVNSTDEGFVTSVTYAAAAVTPSEAQTKANDLPISTKLPASFNWSSLGTTNPDAQQAGLAFSGAVSANVLQSDTEA